MAGLILQVSALLWVIHGNVSIAIMHMAVGVMLVRREESQEMKLATMIVAAIAIIAIVLNLFLAHP